MADVSHLVASKYLKGEEIGSAPQVVTIKSAEVQTFGEGQDARETVAVEFYELDKHLLCNKTQLRKLIELCGNETDHWPAKRVMMYGERLTSGQFAGKWTIHLTQPPAQQAAPQQKPQQTEEIVF